MNLADIEQPPCTCGECRQAGVTDKPVRRDPRTGELLHGYRLKRWWDARDACIASAKAKLGPKIAALLERVPGEDDA